MNCSRASRTQHNHDPTKRMTAEVPYKGGPRGEEKDLVKVGLQAAESLSQQKSHGVLALSPTNNSDADHNCEMLQTVDGEQTRDWLLLTCNVIHNSKINFQILTNTNCLCVFRHSWWLFASPWTVACQAPLSMETGKNTGVGCHLLLWGNLSDRSNLCVLHLLHWQMVFLPLSHQGNQNQLHIWERSRHSDPSAGAQASPLWLQVSTQIKQVHHLRGKVHSPRTRSPPFWNQDFALKVRASHSPYSQENSSNFSFSR